MGSAAHSIHRTLEYRWVLNSPADHTDFVKALNWAEKEFEKARGRRIQYDDDIWIRSYDEEIHIYFTAEEQVRD